MKKLIYIIMCLCAMASCAERREYREALGRAQDIIETQPDSALMILDSLGQHSAEFGYRFRMKYLLYRTYAEAKTGVLFHTDSLTRELVDYFGDRGSGNEPALAYYMHGCALMDIGRAPEALQSMYDAIDRADTVNNLSAYHILRGIYGQMAGIFHKQNLPQDEIWAWKNQIECISRTPGEVDYIIAQNQMIRPYTIIGAYDTVLKIIDDTYKRLLQLGDKPLAIQALGPAIYIYVERGQLERAQRYMELYERESGLFDSLGNISAGREGYYYIKGFTELALNNDTLAELNFRKAIKHGFLSEGYRGLLHVYRERRDMDSIVHFSVMYEAAQDTLHDKMRTEAIHQMASLYNYTRSEKEAEIAREQAQRNRTLFMWAVLVAVIIIGGLVLVFKSVSRKKKQRIVKLEQDLNLALETRNEIQEELRQLKSHDFEAVIASKETRLAELSDKIAYLEAENELYKEDSAIPKKDNFEQFRNSTIATRFVKIARPKASQISVTESEWKLLISRFCIDNPLTYKKFTTGKCLSPLEQRICILLLLDIPTDCIVNMTNSMPSTVSNAKARANEKLFGKKEAHSLQSNLFREIKSY